MPYHMHGKGYNAALVLSDGHVFFGKGFGKEGKFMGEVCFNTASLGYQEVITDPSYHGQIVAFTFPSIGNIGVFKKGYNENTRTSCPGSFVGGIVCRYVSPSYSLDDNISIQEWLSQIGCVGISGVDTRFLTHLIRSKGLIPGSILYTKKGEIDTDELLKGVRKWSSKSMNLSSFMNKDRYRNCTSSYLPSKDSSSKFSCVHIVIIDFGVKSGIVRSLLNLGVRVTIMSMYTSLDDVLDAQPHGIVLSNGPGDPQDIPPDTLKFVGDIVNKASIPILGICLGHQILGLHFGAKIVKMPKGHHGFNHPVQNMQTGKIEIVSMNHSFAVLGIKDNDSLEETYKSLFDNSNAGFRVRGRDIFTCQHHPEASPGPLDAQWLFQELCNKALKYHNQDNNILRE